jgi:hypothetical protein
MLQAKAASSIQRDAAMALTTLLLSPLSRSIRSHRHVQPQQYSFTTASYPNPPPRPPCVMVRSVRGPWPLCSPDAQTVKFLRSENISSTSLLLLHHPHFALFIVVISHYYDPEDTSFRECYRLGPLSSYWRFDETTLPPSSASNTARKVTLLHSETEVVHFLRNVVNYLVLHTG